MTEKLLDKYDVVNTREFKLKDKVGRLYQLIDLEKQFPAGVKLISVEKVLGKNNTFIVRAFVLKPEKKKDAKNI